MCESIQTTLLPPRMRPKSLEEVIRDDEELDTKIKSEKRKIPASPEEVLFGRVILRSLTWYEYGLFGALKKLNMVDILPEDYPSVYEFIKDNHFKTDPLCKAMQISESEEAQAECIRQIEYFLNCSTSLMAVNPQNEIVGVLIGNIQDFDECSEKLVQNTTYTCKRWRTIQNLLNFLTRKVNVHEKYRCKTFYRVHIISIRDDWLRKGVEKALLTSVLRLCSILGLSRLAGAFTMYKDQRFMGQFKAKTDFQIYYSEWRTARGLRIFRGTGKTEPKISFMSMEVPELFLYKDPQRDEHEALLLPLTSDRARCTIKPRIPIWDELDLNRACICASSSET